MTNGCSGFDNSWDRLLRADALSKLTKLAEEGGSVCNHYVDPPSLLPAADFLHAVQTNPSTHPLFQDESGGVHYFGTSPLVVAMLVDPEVVEVSHANADLELELAAPA